jgi:hypothetical protein
MNAIPNSNTLQIAFDRQQNNLCIATSLNEVYFLPNVHPLMVADWVEQVYGKTVMIHDGKLELSVNELEAFAWAFADQWKVLPFYQYSLN